LDDKKSPKITDRTLWKSTLWAHPYVTVENVLFEQN